MASSNEAFVMNPDRMFVDQPRCPDRMFVDQPRCPDRMFVDQPRCPCKRRGVRETGEGREGRGVKEMGEGRIKWSDFFQFLTDFSVLATVSFLAFVSHSTNLIPITIRPIKCSDESINQQLNPKIVGSPFLDWIQALGDESVLFQVSFLFPIIVLVLIQVLITTILSFGSRHESDSNRNGRKMGHLVSVSFRSILKTVSSFSIGFMATITVIEVVSRSSGRMRPNFLSLCPFPCTGYDLYPDMSGDELSLCFGINRTNGPEILGQRSGSVIADRIDKSIKFPDQRNGMDEKMDRMDEKMDKLVQVVRDGRKSFPSLSVTILSYSSSFLILLLFQPVMNESLSCTSSLRFLLSLSMLIPVLIMGMFELVSNRSHVEDLIFGSMTGSFISFFLVKCHLKLFQADQHGPPLLLLLRESGLDQIQCHPSPIMTLSNEKWNPECGSQFSPSSSCKTLFQDQILSIPRVRIWRESLRRGWNNGSKRWRNENRGWNNENRGCTFKQRPRSVETMSSNCS